MLLQLSDLGIGKPRPLADLDEAGIARILPWTAPELLTAPGTATEKVGGRVGACGRRCARVRARARPSHSHRCDQPPQGPRSSRSAPPSLPALCPNYAGFPRFSSKPLLLPHTHTRTRSCTRTCMHACMHTHACMHARTRRAGGRVRVWHDPLEHVGAAHAVRGPGRVAAAAEDAAGPGGAATAAGCVAHCGVV